MIGRFFYQISNHFANTIPYTKMGINPAMELELNISNFLDSNDDMLFTFDNNSLWIFRKYLLIFDQKTSS
jgi:hypothetical protein